MLSNAKGGGGHDFFSPSNSDSDIEYLDIQLTQNSAQSASEDPVSSPP